MWFGKTIYFLADHDANRRKNIWAYDTGSSGFRQITHFTDYAPKRESCINRAASCTCSTFRRCSFTTSMSRCPMTALARVRVGLMQSQPFANRTRRNISTSISRPTSIAPFSPRAAISTPNQLIIGPKICLMNHYSASDGDIFRITSASTDSVR
jgi:hypothetical protein